MEGGGKIFRDGFAVELNPLPETNISKLIGNMGRLFAAVTSLLPRGYKLLAKSTMEIDLSALLANAPDDVVMSGCHPSHNAYGKKLSPPNLRYYPLRHGAGHIHLSAVSGQEAAGGWVLSEPKFYPQITLTLDTLLGSRLYQIFNTAAYRRRAGVYGQWGEFRPQKYPGGVKGLEYRVPGNEIWAHPAFAAFSYGVARWTILNFSHLSYGDKCLSRLGLEKAEDLPSALPGGARPTLIPFQIPNYYSTLSFRAISSRAEKLNGEVKPKMFLEWAENGMGWKDWAEKQGIFIPSMGREEI